MQFQHRGNWHSISRITGPRHNYLALVLRTEGESEEATVTALPPRGRCAHSPLDSAKILAAVQAGVAEANREHGAHFFLASVEYVSNDTGPEEVYRQMARMLVANTRQHMDEEGRDVTPDP
jgi:hypothetical protein